MINIFYIINKITGNLLKIIKAASANINGVIQNNALACLWLAFHKLVYFVSFYPNKMISLMKAKPFKLLISPKKLRIPVPNLIIYVRNHVHIEDKYILAAWVTGYSLLG